MSTILETISNIGILPVIVLENTEDALPLANALWEGGLPCAEVTFRTEAAEESIRLMSTAYPEMLIGAGTILSTEQADRAIAAGAKFIISPGLNPEVVRHCQNKNVPIMPGLSTASELEIALSLGLSVVKFFPAEAAGGLKMIKSLAAPYTQMKFIPTGGINHSNFNDYLAFPKILACGGSWMVDPKLIKAQNFDKIQELVSEAIQALLDFKLVHYNAPDTNTPPTLLDPLLSPTEKTTCAHTLHIQTNYLNRAIYYLEKEGLVFEHHDDGSYATTSLNHTCVKLIQK